MEKQRAKIIGIARHRLSTDGDGVTTLVAFHGCTLRCRYCLNPQSLGDSGRFREYSPEELYAETWIDELYFLATNGGVTFGGGRAVSAYAVYPGVPRTVWSRMAAQSGDIAQCPDSQYRGVAPGSQYSDYRH